MVWEARVNESVRSKRSRELKDCKEDDENEEEDEEEVGGLRAERRPRLQGESSVHIKRYKRHRFLHVDNVYPDGSSAICILHFCSEFRKHLC